MTIESLIVLAVVGVIAGFLASILVRGLGFGLIGNLVVGVLGAFLAGWLLPQLGVHFTLVNAFVTQIAYATIGAVILLVLLGLMPRRRKR